MDGAPAGKSGWKVTYDMSVPFGSQTSTNLVPKPQKALNPKPMPQTLNRSIYRPSESPGIPSKYHFRALSLSLVHG